jgi:hypothetical protein
MTDQNNDEELKKFDARVAREDFFRSIGLDERAAAKAAVAEIDSFEYNPSGRLSFKGGDANVPALKDPAAVKFFTEGEGAIYKIATGSTGATGNTGPDFQKEEIAAFLPGAKLDARGALVRKVGEKEANRIAVEKYGLKGIADFKTPVQGPGVEQEKPSTNPWITGDRERQKKIMNEVPDLALNLIRSADRFKKMRARA